jgi:hypothetical protein
LSTAYLITFAEYFALCCDCNHQLPPAEQNKDLPQKKAWENDHCDAKKFVARIWLSCYTRSFFYKAFFMYTLPLLTATR